MVGLRQKRIARVGGGGGTCLKYFKRRWNRKEGKRNKDFKKGGQAGPRGECLKKRGGWNPLTNYVYVRAYVSIHLCLYVNVIII